MLNEWKNAVMRMKRQGRNHGKNSSTFYTEKNELKNLKKSQKMKKDSQKMKKDNFKLKNQ